MCEVETRTGGGFFAFYVADGGATLRCTGGEATAVPIRPGAVRARAMGRLSSQLAGRGFAGGEATWR